MSECYIRGSTIKYLRIPDEVVDNYKEDSNSRGGNMARRGGGGSDRGSRSGSGQRGGRGASSNRGGYGAQGNRRPAASGNVGSTQSLTGKPPAKQQRR